MHPGRLRCVMASRPSFSFSNLINLIILIVLACACAEQESHQDNRPAPAISAADRATLVAKYGVK